MTKMRDLFILVLVFVAWIATGMVAAFATTTVADWLGSLSNAAA